MTWAEALTALSVTAIAVLLAISIVALALLLRDLRQLMSDLGKLTQMLDKDGRPALESLRTLVDDAGRVVTVVRSEVDGIAETSQGLRRRIERGASAVEDRLRDLEALSRRTGQAHWMIETPYRNAALFDSLLSALSSTTRVAIACGLTTAPEWIRTDTVAGWRDKRVVIDTRLPAVFGLQAT